MHIVLILKKSAHPSSEIKIFGESDPPSGQMSCSENSGGFPDAITPQYKTVSGLVDLLMDAGDGKIFFPSIFEVHDGGCQTDGLECSSGQSFGPGNLVTAAQGVVKQHLRIHSPCPATCAAEGSLCEGSVGQRHSSGMHKSSRRHQKSGAQEVVDCILSWENTVSFTIYCPHSRHGRLAVGSSPRCSSSSADSGEPQMWVF